MRCLAITRKLSRCKNSARHLFCRKHVRWPYYFITSIVTAVGAYLAVFQGVVIPIFRSLNTSCIVKPIVTAHVEKDRLVSPSIFEGKEEMDWKKFKPDFITINRNNQILKSFEFFSSGKSNALADYPLTAFLSVGQIPTIVYATEIDMNGDGINEIILELSHREYGFHDDKMRAMLIYDSNGQLVCSAPSPPVIPELHISEVCPYSAYDKIGVLKENISSVNIPVHFVNYINIISDKENILELGWVIDNGCYACNHIFQIERYKYSNDQLKRIPNSTKYFNSKYWDVDNNPEWGYYVHDINLVKKLLIEYEIPPFKDLID